MADFTSRFNDLSDHHPGNDTDLGALLGVSKQTISAWRNGTRSPKKPHIVKIAEYFNVTIPWLMGISDEDRPAPGPLDDLTASEAELLALYRELNSTGQQTLIGTARGLAANPDMQKNGPSTTETA